VPKELRELDVSGNQFYKLHKVITEDLYRLEILNMSGMQLTEVRCDASMQSRLFSRNLVF